MQPLHDTRWRAGRDEDAVPDDRLEARQSGLGGRRHVGQDREPLARRHRERAQLPGFQRPEHHLRHDEGAHHLATLQIGNLGIHALVGHLEQPRAPLALQPRAEQIGQAARTV